MGDITYQDSNYRFSDPIRFFKANDPYYFEVDNIPLKQLQENCLWLRDQVRSHEIESVKRGDIEELRPYANGGDRVVRVKPGRYTSRINDTSKTRLEVMRAVTGPAIGDITTWEEMSTQDAGHPINAMLAEALGNFKESLAETAMGMTGLEDKIFTWPVVTSDLMVGEPTGAAVEFSDSNQIKFSWSQSVGDRAARNAFPVVAAMRAIAYTPAVQSYMIKSYDSSDPWHSGFTNLPRLENLFIRMWRGVARNAIVDISEELSIEVPQFDPDDFSYEDEDGVWQTVDGVVSRVDLVFIYSKPIDSSGVTILESSGKKTITAPQLGIVRGAGIRSIFDDSYTETSLPGGTWRYGAPGIEGGGINAAPGDQANTNMGFTATSANDIAYDVKGSFPAPDDILNLAPLLAYQLEEEAYQLLGQTILPVAYVWVTADSQVVLSSDVIDIRPFFRTAELTYNERAGIAGAIPQLSLANPAVGKAQLDLELHRVWKDLTGQINEGNSASLGNMETHAAGYVYGGWAFGPEGALYDYQVQTTGSDGISNSQNIKSTITSTYGIGANIPITPDWDMAKWVSMSTDENNNSLPNQGGFPNDYLTAFVSQNAPFNSGGGADQKDDSIVAGSSKQSIDQTTGFRFGGTYPSRLKNFQNTELKHHTTGSAPTHTASRVNFYYVSKKIYFTRPDWLLDYKVDVDLVNCLPQNFRGTRRDGLVKANAGSYFGHWVEKGRDHFTIYVAFAPDDNNVNTSPYGDTTPRMPAPQSLYDEVSEVFVTVMERDGERFSGFVVPVEEFLTSDYNPIGGNGVGYQGNPRIGKCTVPTVMWSLTGIPNTE